MNPNPPVPSSSPSDIQGMNDAEELRRFYAASQMPTGEILVDMTRDYEDLGLIADGN